MLQKLHLVSTISSYFTPLCAYLMKELLRNMTGLMYQPPRQPLQPAQAKVAHLNTYAIIKFLSIVS